MPKLPGAEQLGILTPDPATALVDQTSIGDVERGSLNAVVRGNRDIANTYSKMSENIAANVGNTLATLNDASIRQQMKEDAISKSKARASYFQQADQIFTEAETGGDIVSPEGFSALTSKLDDLRNSTLENFKGSDISRAELENQLTEAHSDYFRRSLLTRNKAIQTHLNGEIAATSNRLAGRAYESPSTLSDMLESVDAYIDDISPAMNPQEVEIRRRELKGDVSYSAIDGLLNRGDYKEARVLSEAASPLLDPNKQSVIDRRIRALEADASKVSSGNWKMGDGGVMYNENGQMVLPPQEIQNYFMGMKAAGAAKSDVRVNTAGPTEFNQKRAGHLADELEGYQQSAKAASNDAALASQIHKMLENVPVGNLPAEAAFQISKFIGVNQDQVASRLAADAMTGEFLFKKARALAPVTDVDKKFILSISIGSAQTPQGRANILYILQRDASFKQSLAKMASRIEDLVDEGKMSYGQAKRALGDYQNALNEEYTRTFSPPGMENKKAAE